MKLISTVKRLIFTQTIKDSSLTTTATVINGILGMIFYILLARALGPVFYGVFAVALATMTLVADVANLGTDTGLIRFVSTALKTDHQKALRFLKLALEVKVVIWFALLCIGWFLVPVIATYFFDKPGYIIPLRYSLIGVGGAMLFSFVSNALQAYQKFSSWAVLNISLNALRLLALCLCILVLVVDIESALIIYICATFLGFFVGLMLLPNFFKVKKAFLVANEFFHYNKWVALFVVLAAFSSRLDLFLSSRLLDPKQLGVYSAANQLVSVVPQLVFALASVVAPKLSSFDTDKKAIDYLKKVQLLVLGMAGLGLLALPLSAWILPHFYTPAYAGMTYVFWILYLAQLIFLISLPSHQSIFYYFSKPQIFVGVAFVHLLIISFVGTVLIQKFGAIGAALTVLIGSLANFLLPLLWVIKNFKMRSLS